MEIPEARYEVFLQLIGSVPLTMEYNHFILKGSSFTEYIYTDDIRSELDADAYVELLMLGEQYNLPRLKGKATSQTMMICWR